LGRVGSFLGQVRLAVVKNFAKMGKDWVVLGFGSKNLDSVLRT